jgi:hypothetical protein
VTGEEKYTSKTMDLKTDHEELRITSSSLLRQLGSRARKASKGIHGIHHFRSTKFSGDDATLIDLTLLLNRCRAALRHPRELLVSHQARVMQVTGRRRPPVIQRRGKSAACCRRPQGSSLSVGVRASSTPLVPYPTWTRWSVVVFRSSISC